MTVAPHGPSAPDLSPLAPGRGWSAMRRDFRWDLPPRYNIARELVLDRAARDPDRLALRHLRADGGCEDWTLAALARASARLANALSAAGVGRGDRVAVLLPQSPAALLTHLATARLGAVALPLFTLFGPEALAFRLTDADPRAIVTDAANRPRLDGLTQGRAVLTVGGPADEDFDATLARASDAHDPVGTGPDDPALLCYTSGTTGAPKGALHGHRVLAGHLPAARLAYDFMPRAGDMMWTPADWAWMGGLCNALMPALAFGVPVLSHRMEKFDPERAFALIAAHDVRVMFAPPTALRLMRAAPPPPAPLPLRAVGCAGEAMGAELLDWGRAALNVTINEYYGQTECNMVAVNCATLAAPKPGSFGRPCPGYDLAILDAAGRPLPVGATGEIAVRRGGASMFLRYWNQPEKTAEKFAGDWMRTGDEGRIDADGCLFFAARTDDVITSSGYRIGPTEIEDCLTAHPAVAMAAAVGEPDPIRTESVVAHVVLRPGVQPDDRLAAALIAHVRLRISPHVAPRRIVFMESLPITATGKMMRRLLRLAPRPGAAMGGAQDDAAGR